MKSMDTLVTAIGTVIGWAGAVFMLGIVAKVNYYIFITGWNLI